MLQDSKPPTHNRGGIALKKKPNRQYKKMATVGAVLTLFGSLALVPTTIASANGNPPPVINECGLVEGNYMCGNPAYINNLIAESLLVNSEVPNHQSILETTHSNLCTIIEYASPAITGLLIIFPESTIADYIMATLAPNVGLRWITLAMVTSCL
jgi:hypothetical protein